MLYSTSYMHLVVLIALMILMIAVISAIIMTIRDHSLGLSDKVLWALALVLLPIIGLIIWLVMRGRRRALARKGV